MASQVERVMTMENYSKWQAVIMKSNVINVNVVAWSVRTRLFLAALSPQSCSVTSQGQSNLPPNMSLNWEFGDRMVKRTGSMHLCKFFIKRRIPTLSSYLPFIWSLNESRDNDLVFPKHIYLPNSNLGCSDIAGGWLHVKSIFTYVTNRLNVIRVLWGEQRRHLVG